MLEEGLRGAREVRRRKERGLHRIARVNVDEGDEDEGKARMEEVDRVNAIAGIGSSSSTSTTQLSLVVDSESDGDGSLNPLLTQLHSHLLSMRNNAAGMVPVLDAMDEAKVALDKFASKNLDDGALRRLYSATDG